MANPQVIILGSQDIYDLGYCTKLANISEQKTFRKDKLISNAYDITVNNFDDYFSVNNSASIFSGTDWLYNTIRIINGDGEDIWNGIITNIERNHNNKSAKLRSKNTLFKYRNEVIEYQSSTWETGADAFKNICDAVDSTLYNSNSVQTSINQLTDASCYMKVNFNLSDNITMQNALEKLGEYSNADVYSHNNEIYFVHWIPYTGGVSINLDASKRGQLKSLPTVKEDEKELINDYSIGYEGDAGTPATDSANGNIGVVSRSKYGTKSLPEMRTGDDSKQIWFKDLTSAVYIGEGYIKRTHKNISTNPAPLSQINFDLFADNEDWIDLTSYFALSLSDESWTNKIFEVFGFTINEDTDNINVLAYEVVT